MNKSPTINTRKFRWKTSEMGSTRDPLFSNRKPYKIGRKYHVIESIYD